LPTKTYAIKTGVYSNCSQQDPWGNVIGMIYNPEFKLGE